MEITVKDAEGNELASGTLDVDTSVNPNTATFTPDGGTEADCFGVTWTENANGAVGFSFQVSGSANGDFPLGPSNQNYTYRFTGTQNANGNPNGNVNWPVDTPKADEEVTWQAGSTTGEPFAASQAAST